MKETKESHASILVDLWHLRCDQCKVALHDELSNECPSCGAEFDSIVSNHVGLASKLQLKREASGVRTCAAR